MRSLMTPEDSSKGKDEQYTANPASVSYNHMHYHIQSALMYLYMLFQC